MKMKIMVAGDIDATGDDAEARQAPGVIMEGDREAAKIFASWLYKDVTEEMIPLAVVEAWLRDRAEQYTNDSGSKVAIENLIRDLRDDGVRQRWLTGDLDDILSEPYRR